MVSRRYLLVICRKRFRNDFVMGCEQCVFIKRLKEALSLSKRATENRLIDQLGHARHHRSAVDKRGITIRFIKINFMPNMAVPAAACFSQINRPAITALKA